MVKKIVNIYLALVLLPTFLLGNGAWAASVYVTTDNTSAQVGDVLAAEVRINTQGESVNVVEGDIAIAQGPTNVTVKDFSDAGSVITFWSRKPSLSADKKVISFVGGTPGGFSQASALLFTIYFRVEKIGEVSFSPSNIHAYKNDGKGTLVPISVDSLAVTVSTSSPNGKPIDTLRKVIATDNMPPEFLAATLGNDASMYDGKLYLVLSASDYQSGVDYFEVQEGNAPFVRTGSEYLLRDQSQQSVVTVRVYDKAGNVRTLVIKPAIAQKPIVKIVEYILVLLLLAAIVFVLTKFIKSKK